MSIYSTYYLVLPLVSYISKESFFMNYSMNLKNESLLIYKTEESKIVKVNVLNISSNK